MSALPLHAAVVHLPLALAAVVPLVLLGLLWAVRSGRLPPRAWALGVLLQGLLVVGALAAVTTGNAAEERVEGSRGESAVEAHAQTAKAFGAASAVVLVAALGALALRRSRPGFTAAGAGTVLLGVLALGLAVRAGHQGGLLVRSGQAALPSATAEGNVEGAGTTEPAGEVGSNEEANETQEDDDD